MIRTTFHQFNMGDVDDPHIYVAAPIYDWQQTEAGKWAMAHGQDMRYDINPDVNTMGYRVTIYGQLDEKDLTFYRLKYQ
jgi:hypothetical protein